MSGAAKILILEDEALLAVSLGEVLLETGYGVVGLAATVNQALHIAANAKPDVAVVDVRLAGKRDEIVGAHLLRQQFGTAVVFLTAQADLETKERAAAVNPVGFLQKPVPTERLVKAIQTAVQERGPFGTKRAD